MFKSLNSKESLNSEKKKKREEKYKGNQESENHVEEKGSAAAGYVNGSRAQGALGGSIGSLFSFSPSSWNPSKTLAPCFTITCIGC